MWLPFKKKKGIKLPPGKILEIGFTTSWDYKKREVVIMTDNGPITLNEKSEFIINVSADNVDPVKIKVIPDFDKRILNFIEIIDPNIKTTTDKKKGKLILTSTNRPDPTINIDEFQKFDEDIKKIGLNVQKLEKRKKLYTILLALLGFFNFYLFIITNSVSRYVSLIATMVSVYSIYNLWKKSKEINKDYEELKEIRGTFVEIVKEK